MACIPPLDCLGHGRIASQSIELDSGLGRLRVRDDRLFRPAMRTLLRRFVEVFRGQGGVRRVEVDCENGACLLDFDLSATEPEIMAGIFGDGLHVAFADRRRQGWWSRRARWSRLVGYRHHGEVFIWEIYQEQDEGFRIVRSGVATNQAHRELAGIIADLPGVERCSVSRWSRRITVTLAPQRAHSIQMILDRLEWIFEGRGQVFQERMTAVAVGGRDEPA